MRPTVSLPPLPPSRSRRLRLTARASTALAFIAVLGLLAACEMVGPPTSAPVQVPTMGDQPAVSTTEPPATVVGVLPRTPAPTFTKKPPVTSAAVRPSPTLEPAMTALGGPGDPTDAPAPPATQPPIVVLTESSPMQQPSALEEVMERGVWTYSWPGLMQVGVAKPFRAAVFLEKTAEELNHTQDALESSGASPQPILTTARMRAELVPADEADFQVEPGGPVEKAVEAGTPTVWLWNVTGRRAGTATLTLRVSAVEADGAPITAQERLITVVVQATQALGAVGPAQPTPSKPRSGADGGKGFPVAAVAAVLLAAAALASILLFARKRTLAHAVDPVRSASPVTARAADGPDMAEACRDGDTLRILFLAAEPSDTARLRLGDEANDIEEELQRSKQRDRYCFISKWSVGPVDLTQALLDAQPHIVHFSGHGTREGELCLEGDNNAILAVPPQALQEVFALVRDQVRCVTLNACYSEQQARVIADEIAYVVGMPQEIGDKASRSYAVGFYQTLGAGRSIEDAHKFGCAQLALRGIAPAFSPVLLRGRRER